MSYLSRTVTVANGVATAFPVNFSYQSRSDVDVYVHVAHGIAPGVAKVEGVDFDWTSDGIITFKAGHVPAAGAYVDIRRSSFISAMDNIMQPGSLSSAKLNENDTQLLYLAQELEDSAGETQGVLDSVLVSSEWLNNILTGLGTLSVDVPTRVALAAGAPAQGSMGLFEAGREGQFTWDSSNLSAKVTADPGQGIYVPLTIDPTGATGAWVRKFTGAVDPKWWGFRSTNTAAANETAWANMDSCLASRATGVGTARTLEAIRFTDDQTHLKTTGLDLLSGKYDIEGVASTDDATGTTIQVSGSFGIRVQRYNTSGTTGLRAGAYGADGSIVRKMRFKGGYVATEGEFYGAHLRAAGFFEDCTFINFEGDGVYVDGLPPNNFPDLSRFKNCRSVNNRIGFFTDGADANVCSFEGCDARANRTWGFHDSSFLGCSYAYCHSASNGWDGALGSKPTATTFAGNRYYVKVGQAVWCKANAPSGTTADNLGWGYIAAGGVYTGVPAWVINTYDFREGGAYKTDDPNARNAILNCYSEGDQNPSQMVAPTVVLNGLHGAQVKGSACYLRATGAIANGGLSLERLTVTPNSDAAIDLSSRDGTANYSIFADTNTIHFYNGASTFANWGSNGNLDTTGTFQMTGELAIRASGSSALRIDARDATNAFYQFVNANVLSWYANSGVRMTLSIAGVLGVSSDVDTAGVFKKGGVQVVQGREAGWTADTGAAKKTATAAYVVGAGLTVGAAYVQAEHTAIITRQALIEAALRDATQTIKALKDTMLTHGLIGA